MRPNPNEATADNNNTNETSSASSSSIIFQSFTKLVRIIMACDAVYYRLYYEYCILCSQQAAAATARSNNNPMQHPRQTTISAGPIPHPIQYWGEQVEFSSLLSSPDMAEQQPTSNLVPLVLSTTRNKDNVLSCLHALRMEETKFIFGNRYFWTQSTIRQELYASGPVQQREQDNNQQTPRLFLEWRDSCRDFLCHLYSYASIANSVWEHGILPALQTRQLFHILELGAGTGFWAQHVTQQTTTTKVGEPKFQAWAYDVASTSHSNNRNIHHHSHNEYHGSTPPFFDSMQSGDGTSKRFWKNLRKTTTLSPKHTVLMICYPPPDSSMAIQTVQNYVQWIEKNNPKHPSKQQSSRSSDKTAGTTVLHIGEFRGLTGTKEFETYMLDHFSIVERWPCQNWGTDASEVTLWEKKTTHHSNSHYHKSNDNPRTHASSVSILNPCAGCKVRESTRRCRLLRTLTYCSAHCFQNHQHERQKQLREMAIHLDETDEQLQFDLSNDRHFSSLD
jgi:hypothetical protein